MPTHEPIEQEAQIRLLELMDNFDGHRSVVVLRPADSAETVAAYKVAMEEKHRPSVLILSRQNIEDLPGENRRAEAMKTEKGGYIVRNCAGTPDITLVANGSDVVLLYHAAEELAAEGVAARVVSIPSLGLFLDRDKAYRESVIPEGVPQFGLTSGLPITLWPVLNGKFEVMGMERFGASAPAKVLEEKFGYTVAAVTERIRQFLKKVKK